MSHILPSSSHRLKHTSLKGSDTKRAVTGSQQPVSSKDATYTPRRIRVDPLKPDEVFYFAFGSNMNPTVLTGRRSVHPRESWPCSVPGHKLSFGVQGLPYTEPGFATIIKLPQEQQHHVTQHHPQNSLQQQVDQQQARQSPPDRHQHTQQKLLGQRYQQQQAGGGFPAPPCVHGVLHRITQREWAHVRATEGVGSRDVGYQVITVDCHLYDGATVVAALTLQSAPASMHRPGRQVLPSQRYLQLLQKGARHHHLDRQYQQYLATLSSYQPNSLRHLAGTVASGAVLLAATAPAVPMYVAGRTMGVLPGPKPASTVNRGPVDWLWKSTQAKTAGGSSSGGSSGGDSSNSAGDDSSSGGLVPFLSWYIGEAQSWTWLVHDTALEPFLGSGCFNDEHS